MNAEIKAKWIEALRSGRYAQGCGRLRRHDDKYCCLGVLCELAVEAGVLEEPYLIVSMGYYTYPDNGRVEDSVLPPAVCAWAGLPDSIGSLPTAPGSLALANDSGTDFPAIADLIERWL